MATLVHSWVTRVTDGLSTTLLDSLWSSPSSTAAPPTTSECASDAATACAANTLTREYMESLQSQTHDESHPLMPHAPVVVAAASCEDVVLRWRSVDHDTHWPIHGYIVQRIPDTRHQLQWETMLDGTTNASDATDRNVKDAHQYLYRVQAVSGTARSHYAYHAVAMNQSACAASRTLMMYLPPALQSVPFLSTLSIEAVQTFVLIISCFLAVFGIVRSNVRRVQRTQSRKGRLREMKKATMAETQHSSSFSSYTTLPRLSSSDVSTEPATSVTDLPGSSRSLLESSPSLGSLSATATRQTSSPNYQRAASFSASVDKGVCAYCNKKFGIFRRRRVCDVCEAVALCRKCGSQAPVEVGDVDELRQSVHMHRMSELDRDALAATRPHAKKTKHKVKTICRDCGDHALRFSTTNAAGNRPLR